MKKIVSIVFLLISLTAYSQSKSEFLKILLDSTRKERIDSARIELNKQFYDELYAYMQQPDFNIDSLHSLKIGKTASADGQIMIINWNIQQNTGQNLYNGIVYLPELNKIIALPIKPSEPSLDKDTIFAANDWPGALYYKIIDPKDKRDKYYLMIGWDRFNRQTSRKTIEAVTITKQGEVVFGKKVFKDEEGFKNRVVVEYGATANLTLQYSKQKLTLTGVRKSQSRINDSIIVVDRLTPLNEELAGQRWAYVPAGNIYDGYIYFQGYWTLVEGISARNPAIKGRKPKVEKPKLELIDE